MQQLQMSLYILHVAPSCPSEVCHILQEAMLLSKNLGGCCRFLFFAVCVLVMTIFVYFFFVEPKGDLPHCHFAGSSIHRQSAFVLLCLADKQSLPPRQTAVMKLLREGWRGGQMG